MKFNQLTFLRAFATSSPAIKTYSSLHSYQNQRIILAENKNKTGIYRWVNLNNQKSYIGSSLALSQRLKYYFSQQSLKSSDLVINQAILKHGLANFNLEILAYCSKAQLAAKEQYYIEKYQPEYNINLKK